MRSVWLCLGGLDAGLASLAWIAELAQLTHLISVAFLANLAKLAQLAWRPPFWAPTAPRESTHLLVRLTRDGPTVCLVCCALFIVAALPMSYILMPKDCCRKQEPTTPNAINISVSVFRDHVIGRTCDIIS